MRADDDAAAGCEIGRLIGVQEFDCGGAAVESPGGDNRLAQRDWESGRTSAKS